MSEHLVVIRITSFRKFSRSPRKLPRKSSRESLRIWSVGWSALYVMSLVLGHSKIHDKDRISGWPGIKWGYSRCTFQFIQITFQYYFQSFFTKNIKLNVNSHCDVTVMSLLWHCEVTVKSHQHLFYSHNKSIHNVKKNENWGNLQRQVFFNSWAIFGTKIWISRKVGLQGNDEDSRKG